MEERLCKSIKIGISSWRDSPMRFLYSRFFNLTTDLGPNNHAKKQFRLLLSIFGWVIRIQNTEKKTLLADNDSGEPKKES
jgi:hypothetical protein